MTPEDLAAATEAAATYETLFVPAVFGQWAPRVLDAAGVGPGYRVLDVACGTGVLARAARKRVGEAGAVAGLDPGPGMLAVARRMEPRVEWRQGTAEALPFAAASFDAVVSQFGFMFMDQARAAAEMLRVAKPGGRVVVVVWDDLASMPGYAAETDLLERMAGRRAADALRIPFALGDRPALAGWFEQAGGRDVTVGTMAGRARFPSLRTMVEADLRGWLPLMGVPLPEAEIAAILDAADRELAAYVAPDGTAAFDLSAHLVTATAG